MVIAPGGPVGGANVLGVTREGATTCPLAKLGAIASAQARNKSAGRLAASGFSGALRAIGVLLASKSPPPMACPNETIRASLSRRNCPKGKAKATVLWRNAAPVRQFGAEAEGLWRIGHS